MHLEHRQRHTHAHGDPYPQCTAAPSSPVLPSPASGPPRRALTRAMLQNTESQSGSAGDGNATSPSPATDNAAAAAGGNAPSSSPSPATVNASAGGVSGGGIDAGANAPPAAGPFLATRALVGCCPRSCRPCWSPSRRLTCTTTPRQQCELPDFWGGQCTG